MSKEETNLFLMQLSYEEYILRKQYAETLKKLEKENSTELIKHLKQIEDAIENVFLTRSSYYIKDEYRKSI